MSQIKSEVKVLKVAATAKGGQVDFGTGKFNQEQNQTIARWIKDKEKMEISIKGVGCRAMITKAAVGEDGEVLVFKAFEFGPEQFAKLAVIVAKDEPVEVIYEPVQKDLSGMKGDAAGQESLDFEKADPKKKPDNARKRTPLQLQQEKDDAAKAKAKKKTSKKPVKRGMVKT